MYVWRLNYFLITSFLITLISCDSKIETKNENTFPTESFEILDEALSEITTLWDSLPTSITNTDEAILELQNDDFIFLRISGANCDLCMVNMISYLNEFQAESTVKAKVYLLVDDMNFRDKANFLSGLQLTDIEILFLGSSLSILDKIRGGAYFGKAINGQITDALPVHQFLTKEFMISFLNKVS